MPLAFSRGLIVFDRFDRSQLEIRPLAERENDLDLAVVKDLACPPASVALEAMIPVAQRLSLAREKGAARILLMGGHVVRAGVQRYLIDLMERGYVSCLSMNGAGVIHDYEFAAIGATTESVARYIQDGSFGLWRETGAINDAINAAFAADPGSGLGEAVGRRILAGDFPHKDISLLAAAARFGVPATVHVGIGYDIIHEHPNCDGAATGALSYNDFLIFAAQAQKLEQGAVMNFGSGVMAPEVYLKALSMARNVARRENRRIADLLTLVCDLKDLPLSPETEPARGTEAYFFRPWKTMLVRTVKDGGRGVYLKGDHALTIPALWAAVNRVEQAAGGTGPSYPSDAKIASVAALAGLVAEHKRLGRKVVYCHGCFDLMHPGHIKYFQAARRMGDVLVVTVSPDRYVDKGPGRPVYNQAQRAESIAALACVDHVAVNEWPTAVETLRLIRPDVYVKGQEFERLRDKTGKLQLEIKALEEIGAVIAFTHEVVFSSTHLINTYLSAPQSTGKRTPE
ncbi:MAG: adenylyltransferase/cytidyltransferase family protein [Desulfovibrionaceae bacterium]|nr:adenylyltransferase/cytidyltransferase family protein [Desulfovibrionaceae bacterium]MBF0514106.1 adenylyltransferase/cytidyltransferase family protein [Desulfovibrionaceae bacterium]